MYDICTSFCVTWLWTWDKRQLWRVCKHISGSVGRLGQWAAGWPNFMWRMTIILLCACVCGLSGGQSSGPVGVCKAWSSSRRSGQYLLYKQSLLMNWTPSWNMLWKSVFLSILIHTQCTRICKVTRQKWIWGTGTGWLDGKSRLKEVEFSCAGWSSQKSYVRRM